MNMIPLRAYNREIENLIDNNQSQNALEHCERILEQYPRCLETFRLMGKAFLELQQFDKAEEVFQKVLAWVPDDFTANLGLSLLREKQTNLDGTIWHMERALEAQPSNTAIQNELQRLYKQRDGVASPRIRLTRGGLVRMYIRGDLIPQAISEIQTILSEDPSRMDIRILQATAYLKSGRKEEAFAVCQEILKELPYCYEANRILFENSTSSLSIEEAQTIQKRLRELDPYYEFTSPEQPDPSKVAEEEVKIEVGGDLGPKTATTDTALPPSFSAFDVFGQSSSTAPDKAASSSIPNMEKEEVPAWMEDLKSVSFDGYTDGGNNGLAAGNKPANFSTGFDPGKPMTTDDSISKNDYPQENGMPSFNQPEENQVPANPFLAVPGESIPAAEPGDIPEWLKALASEPPAASSDAVTSPLRVPGETGVLQMGDENLDFLRDTPGQPAEPPAAAPVEVSPSEPQKIQSISDLLPPSPFLTSSESTQPVPLENEPEIKSAPERDLPDWLRSAAEPQAEQPAVSDFRQEFVSESPISASPQAENVALENQYQPPEPESQVTAPVSEDEVPTPEIEQYLEQLRKDVTPVDQPDWLKQENLGSDLQALFEDKATSVEKPAESEPENLDWMAKLKEEEQAPAQPPVAPTPPPQPTTSVPNVPDWLFTPEEVDGETAPIHSDTPVTHQPPPDWLAAARPDIFSRDFDLDEPEKAASGEAEAVSQPPMESIPQSAPVDASTPPVIPVEEPAPTSTETILPELDFLKSAPVDFMSVDRAPLTDNLTEPASSPDTTEELDFAKAAPAESLPADLAAMLREEEVGETTNRLVEEPTPEFSLNVDIPGLNLEEVVPPTRVEDAPTTITLPKEPTAASAPIEELSPQIPAPAFDQNIEEIIASATKVEEPQELIEAATFETVPPSELESVIPSPAEISEPKSPAAPAVEKEPVQEFSAADQKTIPVSPEVADLFVKPPSVVEPTLPIELNTEKPIISVEPVEIEEPATYEAQPAEEEIPAAVAFEPEKIEEPAIFVPESPKAEEPAVVQVEPIKVVEPAPIIEKPAPKPTPVKVEKKPVVKQVPKVEKPYRPPRPKPVPYVEKPISSSSRRSAGSADLTRAREAVNHGDIQTALRRYIKLVNSNKAIDSVSNDLKELVRKHPKNYLAWQTYGDARLRANRIQEALDAYAKAADLLK